MKHFFLFPLAICLMSLQCNSQKSQLQVSENTKQKTSQAPQNTIMNVKLGENLFNKTSQTNLAYISLVSDNRCPPNVNCIQAGNATVDIELMSTTSRPIKIKLALQNDQRTGLTNFYDFGGYTYQLIAVHTKMFPSKTSDVNSIDVVMYKSKDKPTQSTNTMLTK